MSKPNYSDLVKSYNNKLYKKIYTLYKDMHRRCNNPDNKYYHLYGGNGVTVCEQWQTFEGFYNTIDEVDGWDYDRYINSELELDKDIKYKGNKLYSPETCTFASKTDNRRYKPHQQNDIVGISPDGTVYEFFNIEQFCREYDVNTTQVSFCIHGKQKFHKGWQFKFKDGSTPDIEKNTDKWVIGVSPDGVEYRFKCRQDFANAHNLSSRCIAQCIHGTARHHKKWRFYFEDGSTPKPPEYKNSRVVEGKSPTGELHHFSNKAQFAREHNLCASLITKCVKGKEVQHKGWTFKYLD